MTTALLPKIETMTVPKVAKKRLVILGSTGSVGCQTLDLVARHPEKYQVVALTAHKNIALLVEQARAFRPRQVAIADDQLYGELKSALADMPIKVTAGKQAVIEAAMLPCDWVMAAIVGAAGLAATLAAVRQGITVAFANKETLVCAGPLMMKLAADAGSKLLPVDSEHNAIWQVFDFERPEFITRLILTASGGPFRTANRETMAKVTPEEAVKHPVWTMGAKISIDSATLMNKALEVIEAHFLFDMPPEKIDVLVHPQSVIHSMVEYADGSVLAQLGSPDMRTPIGYTLAWPHRMETPAPKLDLAKLGGLTFEAPDKIKFPALRFAEEAMKKGGVAPAMLNAANEVAVAAFLEKRIGFLDIERINQAVLEKAPRAPLSDLEVMLEADRAARAHAHEEIA